METGVVLAIVFGICLLITLILAVFLYLSRNKIVKFVNHNKEGILQSFENLTIDDKKSVVKGVVNDILKEGMDMDEMLILIGRKQELDNDFYEKEPLPQR